MNDVDINKVNSIRRDVAHYRGTSEHGECVKDLRTMLAAYDAETARADRAEAAVKERDEIILETHRRAEQGEAGCAAVLEIAKKAVWWFTHCPLTPQERLDQAKALRDVELAVNQPHPGSRFLDLAQIVEGLPVCVGKIGVKKYEASYEITLTNEQGIGMAIVQGLRERTADALARLLAWRQEHL